MADLQSSEVRGVLGLDEPRPGITEVFVACCGQAAPKLVAWWTPANFRGNLGGANRRFPMLQKSTFKYRRKKDMSRMHTVEQQTVFPGILPDRQLDFLETIRNSM